MERDIIKLDLRVSKLEKDAEEFHKILEPIREETIRLDEHYNAIMSILNEVKDDVKDLKNRPVAFLNYVIMAIISTLISCLFKYFGS